MMNWRQIALYAVGWLITTVLFTVAETIRNQTAYPNIIRDEGWDRWLQADLFVSGIGALFWPVTLPLVVIALSLYCACGQIARFIANKMGQPFKK